MREAAGNIAMATNSLLADLGRAYDLLLQVDESLLFFKPDPTVSDDVRQLTGLDSYPTASHRVNLQARIDAVASVADRLDAREPSEYVSRLIVECVKLAPPSDD